MELPVPGCASVREPDYTTQIPVPLLGSPRLCPTLMADCWMVTGDYDLMHVESPTELKHITQWRKLKQPRLLQ